MQRLNLGSRVAGQNQAGCMGEQVLDLWRQVQTKGKNDDDQDGEWNYCTQANLTFWHFFG